MEGRVCKDMIWWGKRTVGTVEGREYRGAHREETERESKQATYKGFHKKKTLPQYY